MSHIWSLQSDTVVRTLAIVEEDEALYLLHGFFKCFKAPVLTVYALALDDAINTLCKGIVGGFVVLRHRDLYAMLLQLLHVEIAAVLDAAVRVVDESGEVASTGLFYGHTEGFKREDGCQGFCKTPANNLLRIGISYEMQVAASAYKVDIGYVALPQLVGGRRLKSLDEILPLMVAMVGISRGAAPAGLLHQMVATQHVQERIAAGHPSRAEHPTEHIPELYAADARVKPADFMHGINNPNLTCQLLSIIRLLLVKGLTATAKQLTGSNDGQAMLPVEFFYCLAPDFFLISMPLRSATSISVFRARF